MSEPASQPGAPAEPVTNLPPASEKSVAKEVQKRVPGNIAKALATPDRILLRLNKYVRDVSFWSALTCALPGYLRLPTA
jgi:hypothetical protein